MVEKVATPNNANVITLGMFKLDLEPLAPRVLNNKDAHIDYIKHSRKHANTLWEIVKNARALRPLDSNLDSARKSKKSSHKPKANDINQEKFYLLHMDLYAPVQVESIDGKKYILVIVDDYLRFTWFKFLRSKDEAPEVIIKCLKQIQVRLNATVRNVRIDNGTKFMNQTLKDYYENVGISHQTFVARTPQHNGVVER
nr:integrase, catalytic region, zinc finger, CCHC-type, peptidase aspartic, catalytic [Tanacetum cinerariifolium]